MIKVFIGGSREISRLDDAILKRIDRIIENRYPVLIGDANGADKAVQLYLNNRRYDSVEVFCIEGTCRNNMGHWPVRNIPAPGGKKDFKYYEAKDIVMAEEASVGFMIWDGKSLGTLMNVYRLVNLRKKIVLYIAPNKEFSNLKTETDMEQLISISGSDLRQRMKARTIRREQHNLHTPQAGLF